MPRLTPQALHLLSTQDGVIASWQPGAPSSEAMARAARTGHWRRITNGVYLASPAEPQEQQYLWAAALAPGPAAMLSGQAALACHGWNGERAGPLDVLSHANANPRRHPDWLKVHRTTVMPRAAKGGVPRALVPAAAIDAAAWARTDREAEFIIVSVLQQHLTEASDLIRALDDRPTTRRRGLIRTVTAEFLEGVQTMGERDFTRLCRAHGVPEPTRQVRRVDDRGKRRLDAYWDQEGVVVEVDGVGHLDLEVAMDDQYRQNNVVIHGDRLFLRVSTSALRHEPDVFMEQLADALAEGRASRLT